MIALGSDHAGFALKEEIKQFLDANNISYIDYGAHSPDRIDYPDMAIDPCNAVVNGICQQALLFCGTGVGISMAANKIKGIRACCCSDYFSAKFSRVHNDANTLCLGGRVVGVGLAIELVTVFLNTSFEGGRHSARVEKINALDLL